MADNTTPEPQPQANAVASGAGDGQGNVSNANAEMLTLSELNTMLGKNFKDKQTALESLKETQTFVGKRKEDYLKEFKDANPAPKVDESRLKRLEDELFYSQNPQYAPHKAVIARMGDSPSDVVKTDEFKTLFEDLELASKTKKTRTVLESNPRIGQARTKIADAREKAKTANYAEANKLAVESVLEAYDLNQ